MQISDEVFWVIKILPLNLSLTLTTLSIKLASVQPFRSMFAIHIYKGNLHIFLFSYTYEYKLELEPVVRASSSSCLLSGSNKCNLTLQFLINPSQARLVYFKFFGGVLGCLFLRSCLENNNNHNLFIYL